MSIQKNDFINKVAHLTKEILDGEKNSDELLTTILQLANIGGKKFKNIDGIIEKYSAGIPDSTALAKRRSSFG